MENHEVLVSRAELQGDKDEDIKKALRKLRRNLGHPQTPDMIRILRHGSASNRAIELARALECEFCKSQIKPHVPLPAKSSRQHAFNAQVGIDVKWLQGWQVNQKV